MPLISHVDLRVRDRTRARSFYQALLAPLGATSADTEQWTTFGQGAQRHSHWFGFTEDAHPPAARTRVAFAATSRELVEEVARLLPRIGARQIEGPDESEGYYAVFFEDPDGNRLEVAYVAEDGP